jgi:hypothetical protein
MDAMREGGYHKTLREGQSMSTLILSRSSEHCMREDQATIRFNFFGKHMRVHTVFEGKRKALTWLWQEAVLTPKLLAALDRLQAEPLT